MEKLLLTTTEAAQALGIGRSKLYELIRTGAVESVRIGGSRRIPAEALKAFVASLQHRPLCRDSKTVAKPRPPLRLERRATSIETPEQPFA
jgi:excisionase family DNA binding protein